MKTNFTKSMTSIVLLFLYVFTANAQVFTWDKSELTTAWANASAASTVKTANGITLQQIGTTGVATGYIDVNNSNGTPVLNATGNDAVTITSASDQISSIKITYCANGSSNTASPYLGYSATPTAMGSATVAISACDLDATGVTGTTGVQKTYTPPTGTKFIVISRGKACGSVASNTATFRISRIEVYTVASTPTITLTSGSNPASAMETIAMTPAVYSYSGVALASNVLYEWYTDNTYTTTTTAPANLMITKNETDKTITLSGTPALSSAGTYYYKLWVNETSGNSINGSVVISGYVTPAPVFNSPATKNQAVKANTAITDIVFSIQNAKGANATGLPAELTGTFAAIDAQNGTFTISGIPATQVSYPAAINYTITAVPLTGYTGADITATGTITVKDPAAKSILYLATDATTVANDMLLAQLSTKYDITKRIPQASFAGSYAAYDLIILHESLTGGDAATAGHELNLMKTVDKPILNTKSYFYSTGATPRWNWGSPNNGNSGKGIKVVQTTHPIFTGITISDSLYIYNTLTAKNIQPTTVIIGGYQIAKVAGGVAIHDFPATLRLGEGKTSKYLMISLLNGRYSDLTADGLKLLDNAVDYLLTGTQFEAPSLDIASFNIGSVDATINQVAKTINATLPIETDLSTLQPTITLAGTGTTVSPASTVATNFTNSNTIPVNYTVSDGINSKVYAVSIIAEPAGFIQNKIAGVYFDGQIIHNDEKLNLIVLDVTGRMISNSQTDINMSSKVNGIYIVKSKVGVFKIVLNK